MKKLAVLSLLLAIAITLNLAESFLLPTTIIPGLRIGLANIITLVILFSYGIKEMWAIVLLRTLLVAILSGSLFLPNFYMSFFASVFAALVVMIIYKLNILSMIGLSILSSFVHVLVQLLVASIIISSTAILLIGPYMLYLSMISGFVIGLMAKKVFVVFQKTKLKKYKT